jgi:hypothetical protein
MEASSSDGGDGRHPSRDAIDGRTVAEGLDETR